MGLEFSQATALAGAPAGSVRVNGCVVAEAIAEYSKFRVTGLTATEAIEFATETVSVAAVADSPYLSVYWIS